MNKLFFPQVAEQTIYFPLFAEQSFFTKKPYPPYESNGWPLRSGNFDTWGLGFFFVIKLFSTSQQSIYFKTVQCRTILFNFSPFILI